MPILIGKDTPPREAFERLLEHHRGIDAIRAAKPLQDELDRALVAAIRAKKPKSKASPRNWSKYLTDEEYAAIVEPFKKQWDVIFKEARAEKKWANEQLYRLAEQIEVRPGSREFTLESHWSSTYSTQTDSHGYARRRAEIAAMKPKSLGIEAEVRRREIVSGKTAHFGERFTVSDYDVVVKVASELDGEILRHKPGLSLREWIRACWARGSNPRVYDPFLPAGLEDRLGLDYHGNDLRENPSAPHAHPCPSCGAHTMCGPECKEPLRPRPA